MNIINFAHCEFMMLAMFIVYWMATLWGIDPLFSLPVAAISMFLLGILTYRVLIRRILAGPVLSQLVATFGLSLFLTHMAVFSWTESYRTVHIDPHTILHGTLTIQGVRLSIPELGASIGSLVMSGLVYWFIKRTRTGMAIEATSMDKDSASLMGINTERVYMLAFGIGATCVAVAGAFLSNFYYIFPEVGFYFTLIAFSSVALGGFGSIEGALIAGVIIGVVEVLGGFLISPAHKYAFVFILYLLVVLVRPTGLMGR
jgi:branched-chain amino acid transport system permease protein